MLTGLLTSLYFAQRNELVGYSREKDFAPEFAATNVIPRPRRPTTRDSGDHCPQPTSYNCQSVHTRRREIALWLALRAFEANKGEV